MFREIKTVFFLRSNILIKLSPLVTRFIALWQVIDLNHPKKNGFAVERFFLELSAFLEELTVTSCQFLVWDDFNFHVNDNSNANPKQFSEFLFSDDLSSPIQAHWERTLELVAEMWKSLLCCEMLPNVGGNCTGTLWSKVSWRIVGWCFFLTFSKNGWVLCSLTLPQLRLFDHSVFWAAYK